MIELKNIRKIYKLGKLDVPAVKDISLKIDEGDFVAIMGASGSGKSTLMNILGCLDVPTNGDYLIDGLNVSSFTPNQLAIIRNEKIGFVFQNFFLLSRINALENVEMPLIYAGKKQRKEKALEALKSVKLDDRANHHPNEMSGGQQQRVAIARALINNPEIILADEPTGNLDSKSSREIMSILSDLNKKGITIILVTHEEDIAAFAKRTIRLRDGEIIEDKRTAQVEKSEHNIQRNKVRTGRPFSLGEFKDSLLMALFSIFSNKMRSFLTMLGVIVGVSAVIAMLALGQGASAEVSANISRLGANLIMVQRNYGGNTAARSLTYDDALAIAQDATDVAKVDANFSRSATVIFKDKNVSTSISGVTPNFPSVRNFPLDKGSFFTDNDLKMMRRVAVLGTSVKKNLFGENDPIGEYIRIKNMVFQVTGVMKTKGSSGWRDEDDVVFVPLLTAQKRLFGVDYVSIINVEAKSKELMDQTVGQVTTILRERHRIGRGDEDDFRVRSQADILETVQQTTGVFTMLLTGIAIVSLFVGGIGIMNIMLVSVTERIREIGIRKAIGALRRDILIQFLIEAVIVSSCGGLIGIAFAVTGIKIFEALSGWTMLITSTSIIMSFTFSFVVGLFFGYYPARKASLLNPIEALRHE